MDVALNNSSDKNNAAQTEHPPAPLQVLSKEKTDFGKDFPEVFRATWLHEDHISELTRILRGVEADRVERCLVEYVEENIEPVGWKAAWQRRVSGSPSSSLTAPHIQKDAPEELQSFVVEVMNVSQEKLVAEVRYCEVTHKDMIKDNLHEQFTVPLVELYPLTVQENDAVDIATTAEVVEQLRFFYNHVWQAWDLEEESCHYNQHLIESRMKLYQDIETGNIPSSVGVELRRLVKIANAVQKEIEKTESLADDDDVDEEKVSILIHLHKTLANLKSRFDLLQEPVLRELSSAPSLDLCWSGSYQRTDGAKILVVMNCVTMEVLGSLSKLPEILKTIPQIPKDAKCQSFPSLQVALDAARRDDVIVALPGTHLLQHMGLLSGGGTLIGFGDNVVIESTTEAGDVLIDTSGDFTMHNITLKPLLKQIGIVHHSGRLHLKNVEIEGGLTGIIGLGKTYSKIEHCTIHDCKDKGMDCREESAVDLMSSSFSKCGVAVHVVEGAKVSISGCNIKSSASCGVLLTWPEGSDVSSFKNIPKDELMKSLLKEFEGNTLSDNNEYAVVRASGESLSSITSEGKSATLDST